jgi:hypothetical protein
MRPLCALHVTRQSQAAASHFTLSDKQQYLSQAVLMHCARVPARAHEGMRTVGQHIIGLAHACKPRAAACTTLSVWVQLKSEPAEAACV